VVKAVSPTDPRNKTGNTANRHDQLKQIPVSSALCWLCCVQNCDPAFYLWFSDSCFELVHTVCESVICPEVIWCGFQDIKIQTLTNQKEALKKTTTKKQKQNHLLVSSSIFIMHAAFFGPNRIYATQHESNVKKY